ncbi:HEPN domain-containing protein [Pectobacterium carotovorum subsp. carotovorum]|uniref:HEPN domain-containing protein n=1 Tax=Pectobacterium carotovorum TaxID=554 RepID=UPI0023670CC2|nr:HEPN domain-containing protein [Pectobacterium carotovorum]WDF99836.1 HEPN domain-containing protein [Pectobacterium carotovorum subsp. carotovorum]WDG00950.1 HEPN domain-containing protein [Pectobacterium carotovorum subsp. carotovorum]
MKNSVVMLFGIEISTPFHRSDLIQLFESLPSKLMEITEKENLSEEQVSDLINSATQNFLDQVDDADRELFGEIAESFGASALDESIDNEENETQSDLGTWNFYIRFQISRPLGIDSNSILFLNKFIIESDDGGSLKDKSILRLRRLEGLSYKDIAIDSRIVEQALILSFAEIGIGIAYPDNLASSSLLEKAKRESESYFIQQHIKSDGDYYEIPLIHWSDKFGVHVFPENSTAWDTKATQEIEPVNADKFDEYFNQHYRRMENVLGAGNKIKIATSMLTTSLFDESLINRIILSMTAIEALTDRVLRDENEVKTIEFLTKIMNKMDVDDNTKASLEKGLNSLKFQSISKSCKKLVHMTLGRKDAELFYKLYDYRSQLVHTGFLKKGEEEMLDISLKSYDLAKRLLVEYVDKLSKNPDQY